LLVAGVDLVLSYAWLVNWSAHDMLTQALLAFGVVPDHQV